VGRDGVAPGTIVVLNGTPRSGKSSIVAALQGSPDALWLNVGVDAMADVTPARLRPGIGLRPGGERPDLEDAVVVLFDALYSTVAAWSRAGLSVVVDVGHHDDYSRPLGILARTAGTLQDLPAYFVGVRCPLEVSVARRNADPDGYVTGEPDGSIPDVILRWEQAVHDPGLYDVQVNTSTSSPAACAAAIVQRVSEGPAAALAAVLRR
jgi:chloramphenicol 3-O phosphotransferase